MGGSSPPASRPVATVALASESAVYRLTAWTSSGSVPVRAAPTARSRDCSAPVAITPKQTAPTTSSAEIRTRRPGVVISRSRAQPNAAPARAARRCAGSGAVAIPAPSKLSSGSDVHMTRFSGAQGTPCDNPGVVLDTTPRHRPRHCSSLAAPAPARRDPRSNRCL